MFVAGESAKNADIRDINKRDTVVIMSIMTVLIVDYAWSANTLHYRTDLYDGYNFVVLCGDTWTITFPFDIFLGLEAINYRIPLYTFVFLIALGVDYSIMLIARIREEMKSMPFEDAVTKRSR